MSEDITTTPTTNIGTKIKHDKCPRCGFDLTQSFSKISEDTLHEYFAASLAQTPFKKSYKLFGGMLVVEFEEATGKLLHAQEDALRIKNAENTVSMSDAMDYAMLPSLVSITYKQADGIIGQLIYSASAEERLDYLNKATLPDALTSMPVVKLQAVRNAFANFAKLCGDLVVAAQDETFWEGAGRN